MAYSVDWLTKVVSIPQSDLALISAGVYELNVVDFWTEIHNIQDDQGITYDTIMRSNAPVTLSGTTDGRVVEVINGYTIEFENGNYQVNLTTAKSNILDVRVPNMVSINNQAGIIVSSESAKLNEVYQRLGLDKDNPLTTTPSQITAGDIDIALTGDGVTTSTATRQP